MDLVAPAVRNEESPRAQQSEQQEERPESRDHRYQTELTVQVHRYQTVLNGDPDRLPGVLTVTIHSR